ncbi:MAG: hypothetical protein ABS54_10005 [Hyphomicrobium sp. SCN 65-11]|nr:MAG: hypothetical protein ABS54_10005 [Hyphomicrobium sp. SCN 65-11]
MRRRDTGDAIPQLRRFEPQGYAAAKNATGAALHCGMMIVGVALGALAGDDEDGAQAIGARAEQEGAQAPLGVGLPEAMKVEARVDLHVTARNAAMLSALDGNEGRRCFR